jgi:hypothetical protein
VWQAKDEFGQENGNADTPTHRSLSAIDTPAFEGQMTAARKVMKTRRSALRELPK